MSRMLKFPGKIIISISLFLFSSLLAGAQGGSWSVRLKGKLLVAGSVENEKANTRTVSARTWKKNGYLEIRFNEDEPRTWRRSFQFLDENGNQLLSRDSVTHTLVKLASLRKVFDGRKEIRIYTVVSPLDPRVAVRIRPVHLCTLRLP